MYFPIGNKAKVGMIVYHYGNPRKIGIITGFKTVPSNGFDVNTRSPVMIGVPLVCVTLTNGKTEEVGSNVLYDLSQLVSDLKEKLEFYEECVNKLKK